MCLENERKPTKQEKKEIEIGYKVVVHRLDNYMSPVQWFPLPKGKWIRAKGWLRHHNDYGFYCYRSMNQSLRRSQRNGNCIVLVKVKGIIAIGKYNTGSYPIEECFRCKKIKIIREVKEYE